ncbi:hypothetical protein CVT24_011709 [Panaeolus cyanescens]|uniref:RNA-dependent RNA polymerase n=1 Tax=Panaeolus cyanescens TaxID=181874 RepID=A0A409YHC2_9AGAR|nr:hypothetical protein CVT24_011709 [Panaeolus cyanescens]
MPNTVNRRIPRDNYDFQNLSSDSSDSESTGAPVNFTPITRRRPCPATPQKVSQTMPVISSPVNSGSTSMKVTAPISNTSVETISRSLSASQDGNRHSGTPAGRKVGLLRAFNSLSIEKREKDPSHFFDASLNLLIASSPSVKLPNAKNQQASNTDSMRVIFSPTVDLESDEDTKPNRFTPNHHTSSTQLDASIVRKFAERPMTSNIGCHIIAHCQDTQLLFDSHQIPWPIQYEVARGVCGGAWDWASVPSRISLLKAIHEFPALNVPRVMRDQEIQESREVDKLWEQLELEQEAILENKSRALGLLDPGSEWRGKSGWYGGQIQQVARLVKKNGLFQISLEPMEMRRSNRFARFCGSRRIVVVKIPDVFLRDGTDEVNASGPEFVKKFFSQKFVLCGRCFVPFFAKEGSIYLLETDENYQRQSQLWCGDQYRMSLNAFLQWHNPLQETANMFQFISKWVTRFSLGISNSVPVVQFEEKNIFFIEDIVAADWPANKKAPAEKLMTDGCGLINRSALAAIARNLNRDGIIPSGVQGRIGGSKGFWILHPHDSSEEPKIWIRESQKKIHYSSFDRSHLIFDLLATTSHSGEMHLTEQSILNMYANGIPEELLVKMMEESLSDVILPLLEWENPVILSDAISRLGNVAGTRAQRAAAARSRALGLSRREFGEEKHEETDGEYITVSSTSYTGRNMYSKAPYAIAEYAIELIQPGFMPGSNERLFEKMKYLIENAIDKAVTDCRIPAKHSFGAYVAADPFGILEEGEIFYQFSDIRKHPVTGLPFSILEGDVLVGRYPIRLPSDMRKAKAVNKPQFRNYMNLIIISTKGTRSLASLLAGGDMDGDEWVVFYDPILVQPFRTQPFTEEPHDLKNNFHAEDIEKIPAYCKRMPTQEDFLRKLLSSLEKGQVGLYSNFHEKAIVKHGYHHRETIRLAYIFAVLLDSSKNGKRIHPQVLEDDRKQYFGSTFDTSTATRPNILNILSKAAKKKGEELMAQYTSVDQTLLSRPDQALKRPYEYYANCTHQTKRPGSDILYAELTLIRKHVDTAHDMWKVAVNKNRAANAQKNKKASRDKSDYQDPVLEATKFFAEPIQGLFLIHEDIVDEVKASYAYALSSTFAFSVAFGTLCLIKAKSRPGGVVASIRSVDEARGISAPYLKAITR